MIKASVGKAVNKYKAKFNLFYCQQFVFLTSLSAFQKPEYFVRRKGNIFKTVSFMPFVFVSLTLSLSFSLTCSNCLLCACLSFCLSFLQYFSFLLCFFSIFSSASSALWLCPCVFVGSHNFRNVHARGHCPHVNSAALAHCLRFEALTVNSFHKSCTVDIIIIRGSSYCCSSSGACAALVSRLTQLSLSAALSANCQFSI